MLIVFAIISYIAAAGATAWACNQELGFSEESTYHLWLGVFWPFTMIMFGIIWLFDVVFFGNE